MIKTKTIKGSALKTGDTIQLEDGEFVKVTSISKAPIKVKHEDGTVEQPNWAYFGRDDWTTICRDDELTIKA